MSRRRTMLTEEGLQIAKKSKYVTKDEEALKFFFGGLQVTELER